jgi:hypothetical protein
MNAIFIIFWVVLMALLTINVLYVFVFSVAGMLPKRKQVAAGIQKHIPPTLEECNTCLMKKDLPGLASAIHKLKNSLLLIGLDVLKPELNLLEEKARAGKSDKRFAPALAHIINIWSKAKAELLLVK